MITRTACTYIYCISIRTRSVPLYICEYTVEIAWAVTIHKSQVIDCSTSELHQGRKESCIEPQRSETSMYNNTPRVYIYLLQPRLVPLNLGQISVCRRKWACLYPHLQQDGRLRIWQETRAYIVSVEAVAVYIRIVVSPKYAII